jgi:hypothetical protein
VERKNKAREFDSFAFVDERNTTRSIFKVARPFAGGYEKSAF